MKKTTVLMCLMSLFCFSTTFATKVMKFEEKFLTTPSETNWGFSTATGHTFTYDATNFREQVRWTATSNSTKSISVVTAGSDGKITVETILQFYTPGNVNHGGAFYFLDSNHKPIFGLVMRNTSSGYRIAKASSFPGYQTDMAYPLSDNPLMVVSPTAKLTAVLDMTAKTYSYNIVSGTFDNTTRIFTPGTTTINLTGVAFLDNTASDFGGFQSNFFKNSGYGLSGTVGYDLMYMGISREESTDPVISSSISSNEFASYSPIRTFSITGANLTQDISITVPAGITLSGMNLTGTAPNYTILLTNANGGNTITATYDLTTTDPGNQKITFSSTGTSNQVDVTLNNAVQFIPVTDKSYYLFQGLTALADGNKTIGLNGSVPAIMNANNDNTQLFTFEAVLGVPNQYYIKNADGLYLNFTSGSSLAYGALNGDYSIWSINGTTNTTIRLINKKADSYITTMAVTSTSALFLGATSSAIYGSYTLLTKDDVSLNNVIDGGFEHNVDTGAPLGDWGTSPSKSLGGSTTTTRIKTGATYASSGLNALCVRYETGDATSISNYIKGLTIGNTYKLEFKYKVSNVVEANLPDAGSVINVFASHTKNGAVSTAIGGATNYSQTVLPTSEIANQTPGNVSLTFVADATTCYLVFAKSDAAIYYDFYIDDLKLSDVTVATNLNNRIENDEYSIFKNGEVLQIQGLKLNDKIDIYNIKGQVIKSFFADSNRANIYLEKGLYLIKINTKGFKILF